jgi:uncharacterized cupin superfamily protein
MNVLPGQRLSLQSHSGRAELWVVLDDGAVVQVDEKERSCQAGDEIWIASNQSTDSVARRTNQSACSRLLLAIGSRSISNDMPMIINDPKKRSLPQ